MIHLVGKRKLKRRGSPSIIRRTQTPYCQQLLRENRLLLACICVCEGCLPRGAHWFPLWSAWGRGVSFMELIRESSNVYYACMCSNNKRSSDPHGHPPQASDLTSPQVQNQQANQPVVHLNKRHLLDQMLPGLRQYYPPCGPVEPISCSRYGVVVSNLLFRDNLSLRCRLISA